MKYMSIAALLFLSNNLIAGDGSRVTCVGVEGLRHQCQIQWNFESEKHSNYWIDRYNWSEQTWIEDRGPYNNETNPKELMAKGGYLARVVACTQPQREEECLVSDVYWVPFFTGLMEDIPVMYSVESGARIGLTRNDIGSAIWEVNYWTLRNALYEHGVPAGNPNMEPPTAYITYQPMDHTWIENLHLELYKVYQRARTSPKEVKAWSDKRELQWRIQKGIE